jgi:hypothetical protein
MMFCFTNIWLKFYFIFWATAFAPSAIFGSMLPNSAATKSVKNYLHKICSALVSKMQLKLTPSGLFIVKAR